MLFAAGCGGAALGTSLDVKEAPRKPDGVLLEPAPAIPPPEDHARAQDGVVALRQPISDEQVADVAREYIHAYTQNRGNVLALLTDDAVLFGDNGRSTPRPTILTFATSKWQQHVQDYQTMHRDIVRADRMERWGHEDIGPRTDPPRPIEMKQGDIFARFPLDPALGAAGDPLFKNTLVLLLRRGPEKQLKIAGLAETDLP
jgi:hypothetical protein